MILKYIKVTALAIVLILSFGLRLLIFNEQGGDHLVYKRAVLDFTTGINPYIYTVESFANDKLDHGYAYPPTLLYTISLMWELNVLTKWDIPTAILWKIPVLLADYGVFFLIFNQIKKRNYFLGLFAGTFWLLNPYFTSRYEYTLFEPIQVLFLLLSLKYLGKKDSLAGSFFGLAMSIKLVPIIFIPTMLGFTKNKTKFLGWVFVALICVSLPFVFSKSDLTSYINGAYLVHGGREIQGRPLLSFVTNSTYQNIKFYQNEYFKIYMLLSLLVGPAVSIILIYRYKITKMYFLCFGVLVFYYLFTPVLSRSHLVWSIPFILLGFYELFEKKRAYYIYTTVFFYIAIYLYLIIWNKGFNPSTRNDGAILLENNINTSPQLGLKKTLMNTYYDYRNRWKTR